MRTGAPCIATQTLILKLARLKNKKSASLSDFLPLKTISDLTSASVHWIKVVLKAAKSDEHAQQQQVAGMNRFQ